MRSDVPLGLTLSGGLDSTSIAYVMQALDPASHYCFTASFNNDESPKRDSAIFVDADASTDEQDAALRVARDLGLAPEVVKTDYVAFTEELTNIIYHLESGNSSPAVIPLMQLHRRARERLKVVLEGQGADELLAGYTGTLVWQNAYDLVRSGKFVTAWSSLMRFSGSYRLWFTVVLLLRSLSNKFPFLLRLSQKVRGVDRLFGPKLRHYRPMGDYPNLSGEVQPDSVAAELRRQHSGGLVNLLHYGDALSMAHGIESRLPFLDHRLVEFVWTLPSEYKINLGIGKHIHREAMRGLVPNWIIDNPLKYGFCTPINEQFRTRSLDGNGPIDVLLSNRCLQRGLFDREGLSSVIDDHCSGRADHGPLLFRLLSTELWFRKFIDTPAS